MATVERYGDEIAKLAPRGVAADYYVASLRLYLATNEKLLDCTPVSIAQGILRVAATGLDLGVSCDLLPFGKNCQFNPRYNGIIELALAAGVRGIKADVVREGDRFEYEYGTPGMLSHRPMAKSKAPITHAYAVAEIKRGSFVFEVATREEIDAVRTKFSKSWAKGSLDEIPWYARKTMVRKLGPYLPKNPRLIAALEDSEDEVPPDAEDGEFEVLQDSADEGQREGQQAQLAPAPAPRNSNGNGAGPTGRATEGQIERILDLLDHPSIDSTTRERTQGKLRAGISSQIAGFWIDELTRATGGTPEVPDNSSVFLANESRAQAVGL